jgi:hypothetical protein
MFQALSAVLEKNINTIAGNAIQNAFSLYLKATLT